jgi:hypothetical protein
MEGALLKPGRELDALVAERVMGWSSESRTAWCAQDPRSYLRIQWKNGQGFERELPRYSTDIADAWEVVESPHFDAWMVGRNANGKWHVWNPYECVVVAYGDTAPHAICLAAICLAALKAVEGAE